MLKPGSIPNHEPTIRVGLILPEDHQKTLNLHFPKPEFYRVRNFQLSTDVTCIANGENIKIGQQSSLEIHIRRDPNSGNEQNLLTLDPVIAGRGFHWQKAISISVAGDLILRNIDGYLVVTNELPVEDYLMSVATSEMGAACPSSLIEAQTIVARSWLLAAVEQKHRDLDMDVCNDDCCQRYQGAGHITDHSKRGVLATTGQVLLVDGEVCDARYSKSCGGMTENFEHIWSGPAQSCFKVFSDTAPTDDIRMDLTDASQFDSWLRNPPKSWCSPQIIPETDLGKYLGHVDEQGTYFRWKVRHTQRDLTDLLNEKLDLGADNILELIPENRGGSGRLNRMTIRYQTSGTEKSFQVMSEYEIRRILHKGFLYSSAFSVEPGQGIPPTVFILKGAGWGHGVGLCQIGALGMSLHNKDAKTIVEHYYPGAQLTTIYRKDSQ